MNTHYFTYWPLLMLGLAEYTLVVLSINSLCRGGESVFVFDMQLIDQPSFFNQW
jgi:hypothetical protein